MDSIDIAKGMNGMAIIGSLFSNTEKEISILPLVLTGDLDEQIYRGFHLMEYGTQSTYSEGDRKVIAMMEPLKQMLREFVQGIFREAEHEERMAQRVRIERVREDLKRSSQPSAYGTVAEIATKLGISKSEVRRRKAAGTLDELFTKSLT